MTLLIVENSYYILLHFSGDIFDISRICIGKVQFAIIKKISSAS